MNGREILYHLSYRECIRLLKRNARTGMRDLIGEMKMLPNRFVMVTQLHKFSKNHYIVHLKWANCINPKLYLNNNQSILKINPGSSLEGMMLKLKLQYFGHLM